VPELSEEGSQTVLTIPLRDAWKAARNRRAEAAVNLLKRHVRRHTKTENVILSGKVAEMLWRRGIQNPPRKIRVALEIDEEKVTVRLEGETEEDEKEE